MDFLRWPELLRHNNRPRRRQRILQQLRHEGHTLLHLLRSRRTGPRAHNERTTEGRDQELASGPIEARTTHTREGTEVAQQEGTHLRREHARPRREAIRARRPALGSKAGEGATLFLGLSLSINKPRTSKRQRRPDYGARETRERRTGGAVLVA